MSSKILWQCRRSRRLHRRVDLFLVIGVVRLGSIEMRCIEKGIYVAKLLDETILLAFGRYMSPSLSQQMAVYISVNVSIGGNDYLNVLF